jgi:UPF0755 protein
MSNKLIGAVAVLILIGGGALAAIAGSGLWAVYYADPHRDQEAIVNIAPGSSITEVKDQLVEMDLLKAPKWFMVYGRLRPGVVIQAGEFHVAPGESIKGLYEILASGIALEREITFIEGWTLNQFIDHLESREISTRDEMVAALASVRFDGEYDFLKDIPAGVDMEGYLFPDTYRLLNSASSRDILERLLDEFESRVVEERGDAVAASGYSLHEVVTIASLIEREVRGPEDMAMVSDVIRKRLEIGMPLQLDATVNYATGKSDPGVTIVDTKIDSPYNTYLYKELPIGPIASPGEEAIDAALNPQENPYFFYLTTEEGTVVYARTHDEHVRNKSRYLR